MYVRIYFINSFLVSIWYPSYFRNTYLNMYYIYIFKSLRYINIFITPNPQVLSCIQPAISQFESKKLSPKLAIHLVPQNKLRNGWVVQKHVLSLKNIENIFILGKISITIPKPENCCWELKLKPQTLEITPHPTNLSSLKKKNVPVVWGSGFQNFTRKNGEIHKHLLRKKCVSTKPTKKQFTGFFENFAPCLAVALPTLAPPSTKIPGSRWGLREDS